MTEHENRPNFSTEFGNFKYIMANFGKQNYWRTRNLMFLSTEYGKDPILRTLLLFKQKFNSVSRTQCQGQKFDH